MAAPLCNCRWSLHVAADGYRVRETIGAPGDEQTIEFCGIPDRAIAIDLVRGRVAMIEATMGEFVRILDRRVAADTRNTSGQERVH